MRKSRREDILELGWARAIGSVVLLACSYGFVPGDDLPLSVLQTARARYTNRDLLKGVPLYTCLETISRSTTKRGQHKAKHSDIVQVDVGEIGDQEIYSWPGEPAFSAQDLPDLVGHGLISTGLFHAFATNAFVSEQSIMKPAGEETIDGKQALHFSYSITGMQRPWVINWEGVQGRAAQAGDFWVDKNDFTLLRLRVRAEMISPEIRLKALTTTIGYQLLNLKEKRTLIPWKARVTAVQMDDTVYQDDAAFSHCRVFEAESRIASSSENLAKAVSRYESHRGMLPAGLRFTIRLRTPIRAANAKVGDAIDARLESDLKISPDIAVPRGSIVRGHVREFERVDDPPEAYMVGLEFDELEWQGNSYSFLAEITGLQQQAGVRDQIQLPSQRTIDSAAGPIYSGSTETLLTNKIPGTATFFLQNAKEVPRGFEMIWRTEKLMHH